MLDYTSMEVVLEMPFHTLSDTDIRFAKKELVEGVTQLQMALLTTERLMVPVVISTEYSDRMGVFSLKFTLQLS